MPKTTEAERVLKVCVDLSKLVHKEQHYRESEHYQNIIDKFRDLGCMDIGLNILDDVAAIVDVGLAASGKLTDEMQDVLEEKLSSLLQLIGTAKRNR